MSELAGISNPYLSQIERGLRKPSAEILQKIAKALRLSAETFYIRAGILDDDREPAGDVEAVIMRAPELSEEARHALVTVYRSLRTPPGAEDASAQAVDAHP
jgi:transcriptional regulator with XRE-family HTH domain